MKLGWTRFQLIPFSFFVFFFSFVAVGNSMPDLAYRSTSLSEDSKSKNIHTDIKLNLVCLNDKINK